MKDGVVGRLLKRLQKKLFEHITEKSSSEQPLMLREKIFLEEYKKSVLDDGIFLQFKNHL